jgi:hypothetical protein
MSSNTINLIEVAENVQNSAIQIKERVHQTGKPLSIDCKALSGKFPELKKVPNIPLLRAYEKKSEKTTEFFVSSMKVYLSENGDVSLFDCELNECEYTMVSYEINTEIVFGSAEIEFKGQHFIVPLGLDGEAISKEKSDTIEGLGTIPSEYLDLVPQPEIKLSRLPMNEWIEITAKTGKTRQHNTDLITVLSDGETIKNVIATSKILRGIEKYGVPCKFKITGVKVSKDKAGKPNEKTIVIFEKDDDFSDFNV